MGNDMAWFPPTVPPRNNNLMNEEYLRFVIYKLNNRAEPTLMEHEKDLLKGHFKILKEEYSKLPNSCL